MINHKAAPIQALQRRTHEAQERRRLELEPQVEQAVKAFAAAAQEAANAGRSEAEIAVTVEVAPLLAERLKGLGFDTRAYTDGRSTAAVVGRWLDVR